MTLTEGKYLLMIQGCIWFKGAGSRTLDHSLTVDPPSSAVSPAVFSHELKTLSRDFTGQLSGGSL